MITTIPLNFLEKSDTLLVSGLNTANPTQTVHLFITYWFTNKIRPSDYKINEDYLVVLSVAVSKNPFESFFNKVIHTLYVCVALVATQFTTTEKNLCTLVKNAYTKKMIQTTNSVLYLRNYSNSMNLIKLSDYRGCELKIIKPQPIWF